MEMEETLGSRSSFAAFFSFFVVFVLQLLSRLLKILKKRGSVNTEQFRLRQEIKQLLKEASSFSSPSTFAQAAKLRRIAAAKEKELSKMQECQNNEQKGPYDLHLNGVLVLKVLTYLGLTWWFWGSPIAAVSEQLLQPFIGKMLSWKAGESRAGYAMVGIVPWLILTTNVSKLICRRLPMLK
ncbi:tail-anchored protein insertion receptor WRB isoform X2 [Cinnamomum micranthum f. kanehirae]|uniref:Tail-anchored protein insertion receptor WRB isoform X2 n=1 Tax=Cinnamomum micranthum f. kanehirae TaxID=337451 RepID=A0A443PQ91_9MAGN|nr:tail-anchored protein insertion receptor WRB isoform X2 [Cinnamomum micranthum f. kanehirae]